MTTDTQPVASAMEAYITAQEIAAHNIANIATPGFKRNLALVETIVQETDPDTSDEVPVVTGVGLDLSQGELRPTYNDLDLAIKGEGFFTIEGADGLRYTRNGRFKLNENRILVTQRGDAVLGEGGEIQIPETTDAISVNRSGELRAGNQVIGRLRIADFENSELLKQAGGCEFADEGASAKPAGSYDVHQGYLEGSNVQPIAELVE